MKRATLIGLFLAGCGGAGALGSNEAALVSDSETTDSTDDSVESGIEEPLSGSDPTNPGAVDPTASASDQLNNIRTNPGKWFTPAGCITTTISDETATSATATSVFVNCKGPLLLHTYNGTVVSTWSFAAGALTVTHQATGFKVDNASLDHSATIVYTLSGTTFARHRSGTTSGTAGDGEPINHAFDYTATYDPATRCLTRAGSSSATLGDRQFSASITGYERCGIGDLGCPKSGTVMLSRVAPAPSETLKLQFPGGTAVDVTLPDGVTIVRNLICNPND